MTDEFDGRVVLITGAGTGIGRATARAFARRGARIVAAGRREAPLRTLQAELSAAGTAASIAVCDVTRSDDVAAAVLAAVETFGRLDVAFNNAGVEGRFGPLSELEEADVDRTIATNVKGVWLSMKHEIAAMLGTGGGVIVNNSTDITVLGLPGTSVYTATKAAVDSLTRCAAVEYARRGIRINAVGPGSVVETEMTGRLWSAEQQHGNAERTPNGRLATPEDIADAVLWLAGSGSRHVVGQIVNVDGGLALR